MKRKLFTVLIGLTFMHSASYAQQQENALKNTSAKMSKKEIKVLIDSIDNALHHFYIYQDKVSLMLSNVRRNLKNGTYNKFDNRNELASQLLNDIQQSYSDKHLHIQYFPQLSEFLEATIPDSIKQQERERELSEEREHNFGIIKTEIFQGNIGYLRLDGFCPFIEEARPILDGAFRFVSNCKALIIDMRYNGGGFPDMVLQTQSYFFNQKTRMNDIIDSKNDTLKRWTDPTSTTFKLNMPVYILTSRNTFSGAEDFTYGLQQAKRVTVVGEKTGGGAHPSADFSLGQGFVITIPTHRSSNIITNTDWEGIGVKPDVYVSSEQAFVKAQVLIFTTFLTSAKDESEKRIIQWNLNSIENKELLTKQLQTESIKISKDTLLKYCGNYIPADPNDKIMSFTLTLKDNRIHRHFDDGYEDVIIPISTTKFVIDDNSSRTIEFIMNNNGEITNLELTNQSGTHKMNKKN